MKLFALATTGLAFAIVDSGSSALAVDAYNEVKVEIQIVAIDPASGVIQIAGGPSLHRSQTIQSAALQHLFETEGADQLQRKLSSQIRYIANAKA